MDTEQKVSVVGTGIITGMLGSLAYVFWQNHDWGLTLGLLAAAIFCLLIDWLSLD